MYWLSSWKPATRKRAFIGYTQTYGLPGSCSPSFRPCLECLSRPMDVLSLFSVEGSLVLASKSYLLRFMFIFLITKGLVHFGLVCSIHQPELHRGMTFECKAFLFYNDEKSEVRNIRKEVIDLKESLTFSQKDIEETKEYKIEGYQDRWRHRRNLQGY